jgi:hypothetical protein
VSRHSLCHSALVPKPTAAWHLPIAQLGNRSPHLKPLGLGSIRDIQVPHCGSTRLSPLLFDSSIRPRTRQETRSAELSELIGNLLILDTAEGDRWNTGRPRHVFTARSILQRVNGCANGTANCRTSMALTSKLAAVTLRGWGICPNPPAPIDAGSVPGEKTHGMEQTPRIHQRVTSH